MSKPLKIGISILAVLLIAALVIFIFFPGLPTYFKARHKYPHINTPIAELDAPGIPADFSAETVNGLSMKVPPSWSKTDTGHGIRSADGDSTLLVMQSSYSENEKILTDLGDYDPWEAYDHTPEEYIHFFTKIGRDVPDSGFSSRMLEYYRDITAKDCLRLRGTDMEVFLELAEAKEMSAEVENSYKTSGEGFSAYVGQVLISGYDGNSWVVTIHPDGDDDNYVSVFLKCADEQTAKRIISSIELAE